MQGSASKAAPVGGVAVMDGAAEAAVLPQQRRQKNFGRVAYNNFHSILKKPIIAPSRHSWIYPDIGGFAPAGEFQVALHFGNF